MRQAIVNCQSVEECITEFQKMSERIFKIDRVLQGTVPLREDSCRFDYKDMETSLKELVWQRLDDKNSLMVTNESSDPGFRHCRTFVVATSARHVDGPPTLFRSYDCKGYHGNKCPIWEAGRATSALPGYFKAMKVEVPSPGGLYIDGGIGYNNPAAIALDEAQRVWPNVKRFCLVSIGTGRQRSIKVIEIGTTILSHSETGLSSWLSSVASFSPRSSEGVDGLKTISEACIQLCRNSEGTHQNVYQRANGDFPDRRFPYFRFNEERGLQDIDFSEWTKELEIGEHVQRYLSEAETVTKIQRCAKLLIKPPFADGNHMVS